MLGIVADSWGNYILHLQFHPLCVAPVYGFNHRLRFGLAFQRSRLIPQFNVGRFCLPTVSTETAVSETTTATIGRCYGHKEPAVSVSVF